MTHVLKMPQWAYPVPDSAREYWSRPYRAHVSSSHFSGTFCFETYEEADAYIRSSASRVKEQIRSKVFGRAWVGFDCWRSFIESEDLGRVPAAYILFETRIASS